jgi:flavodoxin
MKTLVVVYSRTGTTRRAAERIARALDAVIYEIRDVRSRRGVIGFVRSAIDAVRNRRVDIERPNIDTSAYELVIFGAPVWAGHVAAPMRAFLALNRGRLSRVAAFCTMNASGADAALAEIEEAAGQAALARLALAAAEMTSEAGEQKIARFVETLRRRDASAPVVSVEPAARPQVSSAPMFGAKAGGPNVHTQKGGEGR